VNKQQRKARNGDSIMTDLGRNEQYAVAMWLGADLVTGATYIQALTFSEIADHLELREGEAVEVLRSAVAKLWMEHLAARDGQIHD
jgi:hypothetical protein